MDSKRYNDWYKKSGNDLNAAKILFNHGGDNALVSFHCQQAIEKLLKGYILQNTSELVDGHSLVYLIRRASQFDKDIMSFSKECSFINQFYVETRYPADVPDEVEPYEAEDSIKLAEAITKYINSKRRL